MRCILACDLKSGIVVRGIKGDRANYRPIAESSGIVTTSDPVGMIGEIRPKEVYIADLDRIMGVGDHLAVIKKISGMAGTMADIGVRNIFDFGIALPASDMVVLGTETAPLEVIEQCQGPRTVVSLDMRHGRTMFADPSLDMKPLDILRLLNNLELASVILLDVARVGSGEGIDPEFVASAASACKHDIIVGGGVRDVSDLDLLERCGASGAIVASAVHDGRVPLKMLRG